MLLLRGGSWIFFFSIIGTHIFHCKLFWYGQDNVCFNLLHLFHCAYTLLSLTTFAVNYITILSSHWTSTTHGYIETLVNKNNWHFHGIQSVLEFTNKNIFQIWNPVSGMRDLKGKIHKSGWVFLETSRSTPILFEINSINL